jgi:cytochrome c
MEISAMKAIFTTALAVIPLLAGANAYASVELNRSKNCVACHAVERRMIGPTYTAIAARYANDPAAIATLSQRVIAGGGGNWGPMAMPPQPQVTPAEAEALVTWILTHR